jgi:hypothetical protein
MSGGFNIQDTIKPAVVIKINAGRLIPDSVFRKLDEKPAHILKAERELLRRRMQASSDTTRKDTISVCRRNPVADVTFSDSLSFVKEIRPYNQGAIPFRFTSRSGSEPGSYRPLLISDLRDGYEPVRNTFHQDWVTILIFFAVWLFLVVRATTRSMIPEVTRFFLFRGINEPASRDTGSLFYSQSTIMNFISFLIIGLFIYSAASFYGAAPAGISPFPAIMLLFLLVALTITARHFICITAGNLSGQTEVFNEYLLNIYYSYRYCSYALFVLTLLAFYTVVFPPAFSITAGFCIMGVFYIYRVIRLFLIFIKRHISLFYLILYLCALEILPFLILVKYISRQV